jgi:hypothetical protein
MFLFLAVWMNFRSVVVHPLYVSVTNMDIDAQKGNVVLSIRIFTDDLETILHNKYHIDGWVGTPNEHCDSRRLLQAYLDERFAVTVNNGEQLTLATDSMVIREDAMWFYMNGTASRSIRKVAVDNRLLTDFFAKQTNLVIIGVGRNEKGYKLDRRNHQIELFL